MPPVPSPSRRRVRFVFTPELVVAASDDDTLHATANAFWAAAVVTHVRPSVTLQRRSLKLVLARPSLPAGIYDVLNQGGPQMHLPCMLHLCGTDWATPSIAAGSTK